MGLMIAMMSVENQPNSGKQLRTASFNGSNHLERNEKTVCLPSEAVLLAGRGLLQKRTSCCTAAASPIPISFSLRIYFYAPPVIHGTRVPRSNKLST